ncbi:uncharacterized protein [Typha latifolia]|uniref:uncharacterized protein isoform X1 n=1 Tax=Typha latifolia TaxID=4733 RepID=UPI003C3062B8
MKFLYACPKSTSCYIYSIIIPNSAERERERDDSKFGRRRSGSNFTDGSLLAGGRLEEEDEEEQYIALCGGFQQPKPSTAAKDPTRPTPRRIRAHPFQSARMRLMRLSEAAENLKRRAATSVLLGKENEARELLVQKKKLMQALERSKNRIEVLDELSAKINEAISLKETELIKYVAMHPEIGREDPTQKIRFASAKCHSDEAADKPNDSAELGENSSLDLKNYSDNVAEKSKELEYGLSENSINSNDNNMISSLKGLSSYRDILEHIDMQLRLVEADVDKFINSQLLTAESKQKKNIELQMLSEILKDILSIRERIASITGNITR